jgi:hypothetical protein
MDYPAFAPGPTARDGSRPVGPLLLQGVEPHRTAGQHLVLRRGG